MISFRGVRLAYLLHLLTTAEKCPATNLRDRHLVPAHFAAIPLSHCLNSHFDVLPEKKLLPEFDERRPLYQDNPPEEPRENIKLFRVRTKHFVGNRTILIFFKVRFCPDEMGNSTSRGPAERCGRVLGLGQH